MKSLLHLLTIRKIQNITTLYYTCSKCCTNALSASKHLLTLVFLSSFNQLCLPTYDSYEELHKMLKLAISEGSEGFGMLWLSPITGTVCSTRTRRDQHCPLRCTTSLHSSAFNSGLLGREAPRLPINTLSGWEGIKGSPRKLSWDQDSIIWTLVLLYVYKISHFC